MITRTLAYLRTQVETALDEPVEDAGVRHTTAKVDARINSAIGSYWAEYARSGRATVSEATLTTSASAAVVSGLPSNRFVALPSDFTSLVGISIDPGTGSGFYPMLPYSQLERDALGETAGTPWGYSVESNNIGEFVLKLDRPSDGAYSIRIRYTASPVELVDANDGFAFFPGTDRFVIADAALSMLRDDGAREVGVITLLTQERQDALKALHSHLCRLDRVAPDRVIDVRSIRLAANWRRWYP